jgi:hypothetical protein
MKQLFGLCWKKTKFCLFSHFINLCIISLVLFPTICVFLIVNAPNAPKLIRTNTNVQYFNNNNNEIFHFVHISDTHLSNLIPTIYERFELFLNRSIPLIKPSFVVQSGDVTHAKVSESFPTKSGQQLHEWIKYKDLLTKYNMFNSSFWTDLRGNHDDMGVSALNDPMSNYFLDYGVAPTKWNGTRDKRVYSFTYTTASNARYSFIFVDTTEIPGLNFPFNVFPSIDQSNIKSSFLKELENVKNDDHIMIVGHYPLCAFWNREQLLDIWLNNVSGGRTKPSTYLAGHYHMRNMYNRFDNGLLELEAADYKFKSAFRIIAFDNGVFSFVDTTLNELHARPLVLITNPKNAKFLVQNESWQMMASSSHVRALVFSDYEIRNVTLLIDSDQYTMEKSSVKENINDQLYVFAWNATKYNDGKFHTITVSAKDSAGRIGKSQYSFSLDGSTKPANIYLWLNYFQRLNHQKLIAFVFLGPYCFGIFLLLPKFVYFILIRNKNRYEEVKNEIITYLQQFYGQNALGYERYYDDLNFENDVDLNFDIDVDLSMKPKRRGIGVNLRNSIRSLFYLLKMTVWIHIWKYMHIPLLSWIVFVVFEIYILCGPVFIAPLLQNKYWGLFFLWGVKISGHNFSAKRGDSLVASLLIHQAIVLPCILLSAIPSTANLIEKHLNTDQNEILEQKPLFKRISEGTWLACKHLFLLGFIFILPIAISIIGAAFVFIKLYGVLSYIVSPLLIWQVIPCIAAAAWSFVDFLPKQPVITKRIEDIEI